ncbi:hypothetical protein RRG08_012322 [Elysia crispata]|uniref:Uncharacterized protein n=1 Tax=Elysia crispata TaxID=231223 RepID=A0AAE1BAQ1_9GAST|nr:hypothetical protein RRG08_012322 [Elysia crispata]
MKLRNCVGLRSRPISHSPVLLDNQSKKLISPAGTSTCRTTAALGGLQQSAGVGGGWEAMQSDNGLPNGDSLSTGDVSNRWAAVRLGYFNINKPLNPHSGRLQIGRDLVDGLRHVLDHAQWVGYNILEITFQWVGYNILEITFQWGKRTHGSVCWPLWFCIQGDRYWHWRDEDLVREMGVSGVVRSQCSGVIPLLPRRKIRLPEKQIAHTPCPLADRGLR